MNGEKTIRIQFVNSESQVLREPISASGSLNEAIKILHEVDVFRLCERASFFLSLKLEDYKSQVNFHSTLSVWSGTVQI